MCARRLMLRALSLLPLFFLYWSVPSSGFRLSFVFFTFYFSFTSPPSFHPPLSLFCHYTRLRSSTPSKTLRRDFSSFTPERTKPVTFIGSATNFSPLPASLSTQSRFRVHFFVVSPFAVLCGLCHFLLPECVARSLSLFLFLFLF